MHSRPKLHLDGEGSEGRKERDVLREDESGSRKIVRTFAKLVEALFSSAARTFFAISLGGERGGKTLSKKR